MRDQLMGAKLDDRNILVVYHYFEKDQSYIDNFCHFLRFGYDSRLSYLIVIAGKCTIDLPVLSNVEYFFSENQNFDYGGYCAVINSLSIWQKYDFYFFINSSVRGPFMPAYSNQKWTDIFVDKFLADVGIVGSVISITPSGHSIAKIYQEKFGKCDRNSLLLSHVQTTCYVLTREVLSRLMLSGFYGVGDILNKDETVRDYEIHLSQLILDMGLNLKCMLPEYNQLDYRKAIVDPNPLSREGDSGFEYSYFGRSAHPYESIFIKTSRATFSEADLMRLAYSISIDSEVDKGLLQHKLMTSFIARMQSCALISARVAESGRKSLLKTLKNRFK